MIDTTLTVILIKFVALVGLTLGCRILLSTRKKAIHYFYMSFLLFFIFLILQKTNYRPAESNTVLLMCFLSLFLFMVLHKFVSAKSNSLQGRAQVVLALKVGTQELTRLAFLSILIVFTISLGGGLIYTDAQIYHSLLLIFACLLTFHTLGQMIWPDIKI